MKNKLVLLAFLGLAGCGIPKQMAKDCGGDLEQGCRAIFGDITADQQHEADQDAKLCDLQLQIEKLKVAIDGQIFAVNALDMQAVSMHNAINIISGDLTAQGAQLQAQILALVPEISSNTEAIAYLQAQLTAGDAALAAQITALTSQYNLVNTNLAVLQAQVNANQAAMLAAAAGLSMQINSVSSQISSINGQLTLIQGQLVSLNTQDSVIDFLDCGGDGPGFDEIIMRTKSGKLVAYFESGSTRFLSSITPGSYRTTDASSCNFTVNAQMQFCDSLGCR